MTSLSPSKPGDTVFLEKKETLESIDCSKQLLISKSIIIPWPMAKWQQNKDSQGHLEKYMWNLKGQGVIAIKRDLLEMSECT